MSVGAVAGGIAAALGGMTPAIATIQDRYQRQQEIDARVKSDRDRARLQQWNYDLDRETLEYERKLEAGREAARRATESRRRMESDREYGLDVARENRMWLQFQDSMHDDREERSERDRWIGAARAIEGAETDEEANQAARSWGYRDAREHYNLRASEPIPPRRSIPETADLRIGADGRVSPAYRTDQLNRRLLGIGGTTGGMPSRSGAPSARSSIDDDIDRVLNQLRQGGPG